MPKGASPGRALGVSRAGWRRDSLVLTSMDDIKQYAQILWDGHLSCPVCEALIRQGLRQACKPRPRVPCRDPIMALVLTVERVVWRLSGPSPAVDGWGRERDFMYFFPSCVGLEVATAARVASDRRAFFWQQTVAGMAQFSGGKF